MGPLQLQQIQRRKFSCPSQLRYSTLSKHSQPIARTSGLSGVQSFRRLSILFALLERRSRMQYSRLSVFVHVQTRVCHAFVYDCIPCIRFIRLVIRLHLLYYYYSQMNTCFLQSRTGSRWQSRWSLRAPPFYNSLIYSKAHSFYVLILQNLPGYCR